MAVKIASIADYPVFLLLRMHILPFAKSRGRVLGDLPHRMGNCVPSYMRNGFRFAGPWRQVGEASKTVSAMENSIERNT